MKQTRMQAQGHCLSTKVADGDKDKCTNSIRRGACGLMAWIAAAPAASLVKNPGAQLALAGSVSKHNSCVAALKGAVGFVGTFHLSDSAVVWHCPCSCCQGYIVSTDGKYCQQYCHEFVALAPV